MTFDNLHVIGLSTSAEY